MNLDIRHCNNIASAHITLAEKKLNIKFAPNGTGKSTIARAIVLGTIKDSDLSEMLPFKFRKSNPGNITPEIKGLDNIHNVMCFNEAYVNQFVFRPDELISNSFDIFIRTDTYNQNELEIVTLISNIKQLFSENQELEALITDLKEMGSAFKLSKNGLDKKSTGMKGLSTGNKIEHIPHGLESYTLYIQSQNSVNWIDWQTKGCDFTSTSDNCPFCGTLANDKKEQIELVGKEYDKNTIKNLKAIIDVINKLGKYFSDEAAKKLKTITTLKEGIQQEHEEFLVSVKKQIDTFIVKLEKLRTLSAFQFKEGEKVAEKLPGYKLDLIFFSELNSEKMQEAIAPINTSIDKVIEQASQLQGMINKQRSEMRKNIIRNETGINEFLSYAGYHYKVGILGEGELAQLKLLHVEHEEYLSGGNQHLSFGERNAFALVLFMYECLAKKPNLIILDDPISSFDKNKKYAILEMLFRRDGNLCLKNKTVLMLTHDFEPIIDTIKSLSDKFKNQTSASFLKLQDGKLSECPIERNDIQAFSRICMNAISSEKDGLIKLIYMRRLFEINDDRSDAYQVISNLLHKRKSELAIDTREQKVSDEHYPIMEDIKFLNGCEEILKDLPNFSYSTFLKRVTDLTDLTLLYHSCTNGYEKLQVFRLLDLKVENSVIQKFINETYHIENEFICQLDPVRFDLIPEYIIFECDRILLEVAT